MARPKQQRKGVISMKVTMREPVPGATKQIKVGWSWTCFFFSWFFGVPLFLRRLYGWGILMAIVGILLGFAHSSTPVGSYSTVEFIIELIDLGLSIFLGIKGNEMAAKTLRKAGW
jgi:hypothetical protein